MSNLLREWLATFGWGIIGMIIMGVGYFFVFNILCKVTPFDEVKEIEKGNVAMAIVLGALIISFAIVISAAIKLL